MEQDIASVKYVGPATVKRLAEHGITTIEQLAAMPVGELAAIPGIGGSTAPLIIASAQGIVNQPAEVEAMETETPAVAEEVIEDGAEAVDEVTEAEVIEDDAEAVDEVTEAEVIEDDAEATTDAVAEADVIEGDPVTDTEEVIAVEESQLSAKEEKKQAKKAKKAVKKALKKAKKLEKDAKKAVRKADKKAQKKAKKSAKKANKK